MTYHPTSRREFIKVGVLGAGLTLAESLRLKAAEPRPVAERSAILVFLKGGPSHQDMFDLKPEAPAEYRGEFRPIATNVPGVEICEHLPQLARLADKYVILRSVSHNLADHGLGSRYLLTGNRPTPVLRYPVYGSVVSKVLSSPQDLPAYVAIDEDLEGPGFLGAAYGALATGERPRFGRPFSVRGITLDEGLTLSRFDRRRKLADEVDTAFRGFESLDDHVAGLDRFSRQAYEIISSKRSREAFDLTREKQVVIDRFGREEAGQSMLLACRLIEAGVRFVTVIVDGWDTHNNNFRELKTTLLPQFDRGFSALLETLEDRRVLDSTAVLCTGEFGRTPKVNGGAGRDHWARAMFSVFAGGKLGGQALGRTDATAAEPVDEAYTPDDVAATFLHQIGIDPHSEFPATSGRPVQLVRDGNVIKAIAS